VLAKQALYHLSQTSSPFFCDYFGDVLQTISQSWSETMIFLISASQVARITGMNHQCSALSFNFKVENLNVKVFTTKRGISA
jgi:hypothetical protein